jgi:hypothetical protein
VFVRIQQQQAGGIARAVGHGVRVPPGARARRHAHLRVEARQRRGQVRTQCVGESLHRHDRTG